MSYNKLFTMVETHLMVRFELFAPNEDAGLQSDEIGHLMDKTYLRLHRGYVALYIP